MCGAQKKSVWAIQIEPIRLRANISPDAPFFRLKYVLQDGNQFDQPVPRIELSTNFRGPLLLGKGEREREGHYVLCD